MSARAKRAIPALPANVQIRQHLLDRLQQGRQKKLTLLAAPAGYGKTTLLATWATVLEAEGWVVCWLSLQTRTNENGRFLQNLITSLQGEARDVTLSFTPDQQLQYLIEQLNQIASPTALFLDDYHFLENETVHLAMQHLIAELPAHVHLVISTRQQPPLQLARWRANQQLTELTQQDLSFSVAETAVLFQQHHAISTTILEQLAERTEGWIAGLQLARLMLNNATDQDPNTLLSTISGNHRTIFEYLSEEVFQQQPGETQRFLLQTSILEQLTADLCTAVAPEIDSQRQLAYLVQNNLFISQIDPQGNWYRYHHLCSQFL